MKGFIFIIFILIFVLILNGYSKMNLENQTWVILRPNIVGNNIKNVGIMGSGFFVDSATFVTAYHVVNNQSFTPNKDYNNSFLIIKNPTREEVKIYKENVKYYPEKDVTIINVKGHHDFFDCEEKIEENSNVYNYGYPSKDINLLLTKFFELKSPKKQSGKIEKIINDFTINSIDVNIKNKQVIIVDYSSEEGFSGGPLFYKNKLIGMMSMIVPPSNKEYANKAVAISCSEFK